ncbi:unnamed protein product, partial [marine sediment metagenome]
MMTISRCAPTVANGELEAKPPTTNAREGMISR